MVNRLIFLMLAGLAMTCKPTKLMLPQEHNHSDILRLDGYYVTENIFDGEKYYLFYFLYRNGILYGGTNVLKEKLNVDKEREILSELRIRSEKSITMWGVYVIYKDKGIELERWDPGPPFPPKTIVYQGHILNDKTFVITKYKHYFGNIVQVQDTFRFREFSPKPDSINRFIK